MQQHKPQNEVELVGVKQAISRQVSYDESDALSSMVLSLLVLCCLGYDIKNGQHPSEGRIRCPRALGASELSLCVFMRFDQGDNVEKLLESE